MPTYSGTSGNDTITGSSGDDFIYGLAGNDILNGGGGNDYLEGGDFGDTLDGGTGQDTLVGGGGSDTYYVDNVFDSVVELVGEGTADKVFSSVSYTLSSNVERLELTGTAITGIGNSLGNLMIGNASNNLLQGEDGSDTLYGGAGNDTLQGGTGTIDQLYGEAGNDILQGQDGNDILNGGADSDELYGGAGADQLRGDGGDDTMWGGADNDVYYVDSAGDAVVEVSGEGQDGVHATISYTLTANVEGLTLDGSSNINGTGTGAGDFLIGNVGDNILSGLGGVDNINGGAGNDTIIGGVISDNLDGGAGSDTFVVLEESVGTATLEVDNIHDFVVSDGDRVDLSAIDADSGSAGNQAFFFVSTLTGVAGQATLAYASIEGVTYLNLDNDGDGVSDYRIRFDGDVSATSANILTGSEPVGVGGWLL
ncbi:MAG: calcium-binding protein [Alphaproteobacteria bacterium]|nr:MAG: calcium-binding protein [Alphaproteobacteria bacterium]